eukprot:scaffold1680_cov79-Cylindrotheca_fusiformis.AAC.8
MSFISSANSKKRKPMNNSQSQFHCFPTFRVDSTREEFPAKEVRDQHHRHHHLLPWWRRSKATKSTIATRRSCQNGSQKDAGCCVMMFQHHATYRSNEWASECIAPFAKEERCHGPWSLMVQQDYDRWEESERGSVWHWLKTLRTSQYNHPCQDTPGTRFVYKLLSYIRARSVVMSILDPSFKSNTLHFHSLLFLVLRAIQQQFSSVVEMSNVHIPTSKSLTSLTPPANSAELLVPY